MNRFLRSLRDRLVQSFDPEAMGDALAAWSLNLFFAAITFLTYYVLWRIVRFVMLPVLRRLDVDETSRSFFETVTKLVILTLGAVAALSELGINTASLLASLGVAGLTLGFVARDALSNIISGIFIFWDRPFVIGDLIEVDTFYGRVERITLRSTRVVTVDGRMLAIPNSQVVNRPVASYTNYPHLRLDIPISVDVREDLAHVRRTLLDVVERDPDIMDAPGPRVVVAEIGDYNMVLEVQGWLADERDHILERFELREELFEALRDAKVVMPVERIAVEPLEVRMAS